jgi:hypothetical protein
VREHDKQYHLLRCDEFRVKFNNDRGIPLPSQLIESLHP